MGRIYLSKFVAGAMTASDGERVNWRDARKEEFSRGGNWKRMGREEANVWRGTRALWWLAGRRKRKLEARRRREEMIEEAPCIRLLVSGAATYDFIGCLPLHRLDESKIWSLNHNVSLLINAASACVRENTMRGKARRRRGPKKKNGNEERGEKTSGDRERPGETKRDER